nr:putative entry exclusion protein TrbK-alt [Bradyrhizobium centrosematis]
MHRCRALRPQDAKDPHCQAVWEENRARLFGGPARPVPQQAAPATPSTTNAAEGDNDEQRRRHRHLPQHLHHLYRFRLRPDPRRDHFSRLDADRHSTSPWPAVLGVGRRRRHPPAAGEEDALHRILRLQHSLGHHLQ